MNLHEQILDSYDSLVVFSFDKEYRIRSLNKSGARLLHQMYGRHAKIGDCILEYFRSGYNISLAQKHFDMALKGKSFTVTRPFDSGDSIRYLNLMYAPLKEKGQISGFSAMVVDVTEKMKHDEERIHVNELYKSLFMTSTDAIMTLEPPSWNFTTGNTTILHMFKVKNLEEWTAIGPWQVSPKHQPDGEASGQKAKRMIEIAMQNGSHFFEWIHQRMDGTCFPATVLLTRVDYSKRHFLQATIRDITKEKQAEKELKTQTELQSILMKISSKYINTPLETVHQVIHDSLREIGKFVKADRSYLFEFDAINKTISNTYEWCAQDITSVIAESQQLPMNEIKELVDPLFNGDYIYIADTARMIDSNSKNILITQEVKSLLTVPLMHGPNCIGFVGFDSVVNHQTYTSKEIAILKLYSDMLVNIQMRTEKQMELEQLLYTTKDQNKRLKEFSYITSHNLRASVANLIGLSDMIEVIPESREYLSMLKITTQKLDKSLTNINDLINFENENDLLEKVDCSLSEAVQRVLKLTNQIMKHKEVELTVDIEESHTIKAFPAYLDSIFHNLITNALKYGITDTAKKLSIRANKETSGTSIFIQDEGLGIDLTKYRNKMFQIGTRLHDISDGQGLGLFMTKRQLEAMGGHIEVDSQTNLGTTFKLHFQN
ncbi:ATP-binding protein [Reichenbachiella carrageenanivorans]|uniref:histidine kinase n=1 Tax=Reichenbachiella carrageenanivorans TaxID=2979869 RepID=A0ABY6CZH5_9BACT|nr:ATP-binding protein [Reichenbachiella carrageenanivorans]UXX79104.1 ATP-binding protein [Reichenbachiella carrageenanivorans]